ncbi:phosphatidylserine/phosphatidylglycerophosphate/cardiolipin synthase-like enzyme [Mycolicibacterium sp. BK556]|uniref:phospholipase D-like domain-containing protein n=1 Tax=unclassified Mycolicibacterium TaxID=2636767 RepID=UPI00161FD054|nr:MULTISPECIES: phospholipase D-like domain-containing protein [unclassified Mycolicibacterium]MBB3606421.1 phosphatidylserine/phosphatidylglycerophosphate/cardiolipin synthase-like enzyme [Mycolicibacterium sp. BK556]MBB3636333.1 phosphatidylserine/phosphatidylglycerophosphate/cardiolipin synthase-like enzyme [Mycolicibacterium sp. BK607]MBB3753638.1 phosphatidylserine/phosphatidylglycerophosphate/cardiolipin synthase-like enzyme [Mycolicibacterium sp. BK634]
MTSPVTIKVYANDDDALIFWSVPKAIPHCLGFAIERRVYDPADPQMEKILHTNILPNRIGFAGDPGAKAGQTKVSTKWPFQRFWWTDHAADQGDIVSYRVIPMVEPAEMPVRRDDLASEWSEVRVLLAPSNSRFFVFFNRGFIISQFMARYLEREKITPRQFKDRIGSDVENYIRRFLYGNLGAALLTELGIAQSENGHVFAALYELDDEELIAKLCSLGKRAHVVLSNGSVPHKKGAKMADERLTGDQNKIVRKRLLDAGVDVGKHDRFVSPGALGHNKFMIRTDANKKPQTLWTGSTNWTTTGLCTQLNNGLLTKDPDIVKTYMAQWKLLRRAKSDWTEELVGSNTAPKPFEAPAPKKLQGFVPFDTPPPASTGTVWFTRTHGKTDLKALNKLVGDAQAGILFLMFMPGTKGVLQMIRDTALKKPDLYLRGVVSELPDLSPDAPADGPLPVQIDVHRDEQVQRLRADVVQPEGIEHPMSKWALGELTHAKFKGNIGNAIVHSKCMVIDPFSDHPVVVTGSHNMSEPASTANDENFIIIHDEPALAQAYAVHIMAAYDHYRYRAVQQKDKPLSKTGRWMAPKLRESVRELAVWGVRS